MSAAWWNALISKQTPPLPLFHENLSEPCIYMRGEARSPPNNFKPHVTFVVEKLATYKQQCQRRPCHSSVISLKGNVTRLQSNQYCSFSICRFYSIKQGDTLRGVRLVVTIFSQPRWTCISWSVRGRCFTNHTIYTTTTKNNSQDWLPAGGDSSPGILKKLWVHSSCLSVLAGAAAQSIWLMAVIAPSGSSLGIQRHRCRGHKPDAATTLVPVAFPVLPHFSFSYCFHCWKPVFFRQAWPSVIVFWCFINPPLGVQNTFRAVI